jgi:pyridoxine 4-dehydrogenase
MADTIDARRSGQFKIGGDLEVNRLGFGAMRITGKGVWGEPADVAEARRVLRRVPELGIDFIDSAESYGPHVSERLIGEELAPHRGLTIATKGGLERPGPDSWLPNGDPKYLRRCLEGSLERLRLKRIELWQLHRIDPKAPRDDQFRFIADVQREGLVRHAGLSEVSVDEIEAAGRFFRVATVHEPPERAGARLLREERHWFHSLVPARRRQPRSTWRPARQGGRAREGHAFSGRARLDLEA